MTNNKTNLQDYISKRIRLLRLERGYTQEQLEEMADLGTNYIYKLENLSTNLKIQTLEKVMEALEVDLDTFFDIPFIFTYDLESGKTLIYQYFCYSFLLILTLNRL